MTSQSTRGFNADDARSLAGSVHRNVAEFVVADVLREAESAARDCRRTLKSCINVGQLSDEECEGIAKAIEARGFDVALTRDGDQAVLSLHW